MASFTMSAPGRAALTKEEASIDGLYNDQKGYCTFGIGHLVHTVDKWGSFLLTAAQTSDPWKKKLLRWRDVTYLPRSAVTWSDWNDLRTKAVELGQETVALKRSGKALAQLTAAEQASIKTIVETTVAEESRLLTQTVPDVFGSDLPSYEAIVNSAITGVVLTQEEFEALVSLAFNIGPKFKWTPLAKKINLNQFRQGDSKVRDVAINEIESAFLSLSYGDAYLAKRRRTESDRFLKGARQELAAKRLNDTMASAMKTRCAPR